MFTSVSKKMFIFCVSYIWVVIGFMMMFTILFSWKRHLNINGFPGTIVSVLVMMMGEVEFLELQYPKYLKLNDTTGNISEESTFPHFPITAHVALLLFILVFCLVTMNLLVGIAVSDINELMKTSKIDQLVDRVDLACSVLNFRNTGTFQLLPQKFQDKFKRMLDDCKSCDKGCECFRLKVRYKDPTNKRLPENHKKMLYDFCIEQEKKRNKKKRIDDLNDIKQMLLRLSQSQ